MSMLAERRVKQRWSLNPRGKAWSEDSNKFGQKILEKMGWSKGKGLGPKEDGIVEHVKLSYKNDSKGMGYKDSNDQWTEHESNFTALLESLSGDKPPERPQIASLEQKSQSSRVRVHYKKFTRGKDLSQRSEKDLANIFGRKSLRPEVAPAPSGGDDDESKGQVRDSFTLNGGSMVDYFKRKLPNFGKSNSYNVGSNGVLKCHSGTESEEEQRPGFGCEKKRKLTAEECDVTPKKKKKKEIDDDLKNVMSPSIRQAKKKRKEEEEEKGLKNPAFDPLYGNVKVQKHVLNTIEEEDEMSVKNEEILPKKKSKGREEDSGIDNSSDDGHKVKESGENEEICVEIGAFEAEKKEKDRSSSLKEDINLDGSQNVKKKKIKIVQSSGIENPNFDDLVGDGGCKNSNFEVKRKKKKSNNIVENGCHDNNIEETSNRSFENGCHDNVFEVKRKKKKRKEEEKTNRNVDIVENGCHDNNIEIEDEEASNSYSQNGCHDNVFEVKRKTKKKRKGEENTNRNVEIVENGCHDNNIEVRDEETSTRTFENGCHDNVFEVKSKKKKRKSEENTNRDVEIVENGCHDNSIGVKGVENPSFNTEDSQTSRNNNDFEVKRKKKKKNQSQDESLAIDNPNFDSMEGCQNSYVDGNFEVKRKDKKKKKKGQSQDESLAVDNPNFDSTEDCQNSCVDSNFEVKRKEKKKKKSQDQDESLAIDNPNFDSTEDCQNSYVDSNFEVKRKEKKKKKKELAIDNPNYEESVEENQVSQPEETPQKETTEAVPQEPGFDLMLNITSTPCLPKPENSQKASKSSVKRRKSVRFSDVTEQRIIPNNEDVENRNELFDINSRIIEDGLNEISKKIDGFQAEIENDINQAKLTRFIGEVGTPDGENEKLPEGTRLKFKYAKFGRTPSYHHKSTSKAQTSYKHLIKGDIILGFNNTNLHEIAGYGVRK